MVTATVREVRLNLSKFLKLVERGEQVIVRNRNTPVARIVPCRELSVRGFPDLTAFRNGQKKTRAGSRLSSERIIREDRDQR